jgi:hypothetical protein
MIAVLGGLHLRASGSEVCVDLPPRRACLHVGPEA